METESQVVERPKVKKNTPVAEVPQPEEPKAQKKEVVVKDSEALGALKTSFIAQQRKAAQAFLALIDSELKVVDVGHPHYANLKFTKIRAERIIFSLDELSRGKGIRV
jgi:hypothetical protein